jgi:hypothetical protein
MAQGRVDARTRVVRERRVPPDGAPVEADRVVDRGLFETKLAVSAIAGTSMPSVFGDTSWDRRASGQRQTQRDDSQPATMRFIDVNITGPSSGLFLLTQSWLVSPK